MTQAVQAGATNVTIVSADKDLAQLVTRRVKMFNYYTDELLGPEEVRETGQSRYMLFKQRTTFILAKMLPIIQQYIG